MTHIFTFLLAVMASLSLSSQTSNLRQSIYTPECQEWVDSVYNSLSEQERIAQLIFVSIAPNQGEKSKANIRALVKDNKVGGVFFSKGTAEQFATMTDYAQSIAKVPLLMSIDGEWGVSMRVTDAPIYPRNMTLGAIQDSTLLFRYGQQVARECRDLGIHINYAPVLDVNSNPSNPVIGDRSFGEDPQRVASLGRAYSLGLEQNGVMAVGKHFPGHGDTDSDSHKTLPTVNHTAEKFDAVDLVPFKAFVKSGCSGIMVGHLAVPAFDPSNTPASLSRKVTTGLLRDQLGFDGLVITDGLGMKGAQAKGNVCVAALKAGADALCDPGNVPVQIKAIQDAINRGELSKSDVENSCRRILAYKYALKAGDKDAMLPAGEIKSALNSPETEALIQELANNAITAVRNDGVLPIGDLAHTSIALVNIGGNAVGTHHGASALGQEMTELCRRYADVEVYNAPDGAVSAATAAKIKDHDVVIAAVYADSPAARQSLAAIVGANHGASTNTKVIPVMFINPYKTAKYAASLQDVPALLMAYENSPALQRAAAMALFGGVDVTGRMPVNVNGVASVGQGVDINKSRLGYSTPIAKGLNPNLTARIDSAMRAAMGSGAFPGAQVLVAKDGDVIIDRCYGLTTAGGAPVTGETVYDLASVSKTVGTLPGVMKAYDLGLFALDEPASRYIPGLAVDGKRDITPRMLLYHETGIPASLNMYKTMMDSATYTGRVVTNKRDKSHTIAITGGGYGHSSAKMRGDIVSRTRSDRFPVEMAKGMFVGQSAYDTIMANIYRAELRPTRKFLYSCLNFCLLMDLEQRVTGQPHQQWVTDSVWAPLGAYTMCYRPTERHPLSKIAATENDTYLRRQHVHGYVHDELAAFSGGVQGNAGVFGNATDIAKLCQMWLNGGTYGDARVLSDETSTLFTTDKSPTCRRGLGFDKPDMVNPENSPCCDEVTAAVYGHTGFTGTCFWVDPDSGLIFVFLSNRVDPSRSNKAFSASAIRPTLMSLIYQSM